MQIFIGNLAYATTHQGLRQAFEAYGTVEGVSIPLDWATGGSRGFGFVEMPNAMEAAAAIASPTYEAAPRSVVVLFEPVGGEAKDW